MQWWQKISTKKPWWVISISIITLIGLGWYASGLFQNLSEDDSFSAAGTESVKAQQYIEDTFGSSPSSEIILFESQKPDLTNAKDPEYQQKIANLLAPLEKNVESITTYQNQPNEAFISKSGKDTYALIVGKGERADIYKTLDDFVSQLDQSEFKIHLGGTAATITQTNQEVADNLVQAELISLPILLLLLIIFFRSGVAALIPLGMSLVTIVGAFAIARGISSFVTIDQYAVNVITILGLGLSIDYALLSVNRFREELERTRSVEKAVGVIITTSGSTILFSGITVIACLLSLLFFQMDFLRSIAIGGAAAVTMAVVFTVAILPALLQLVGRRINNWRIPLLQPHKTSTNNHTFWHKIADLSTKHPVRTLIGTFTIIALALLPLQQFKLISGMDHNWLAQHSSSQYVAQKITDDFESSSPSISVVASFKDSLSEKDKLDYSCDLTQKIASIKGVERVISATPLSQTVSCDDLRDIQNYKSLPEDQKSYMTMMGMPAPDTTIISQIDSLGQAYTRDKHLRFDVVTDGDQTSKTAYDALANIRNLNLENDATLHVGGMTALMHDTDAEYARAMPWAVGAIIVAMFILLSWHLKSFILPLQAIVINSIAIAISLSLLVGIFELGWGSGLTGWGTTSGIVMMPILLISTIAFGLAMDYSVFLYSRMHEEYESTKDPIAAIKQGMIKTGPIITAAALMMFVVVSAFAGSNVMIMQMIGVGLGIAVLVDAFFVRLFLVPSIMAIMGKASWWNGRKPKK